MMRSCSFLRDDIKLTNSSFTKLTFCPREKSTHLFIYGLQLQSDTPPHSQVLGCCTNVFFSKVTFCKASFGRAQDRNINSSLCLSVICHTSPLVTVIWGVLLCSFQVLVYPSNNGLDMLCPFLVVYPSFTGLMV